MKRYRDARNGQFIPKHWAVVNPDTTVAEEITDSAEVKRLKATIREMGAKLGEHQIRLQNSKTINPIPKPGCDCSDCHLYRNTRELINRTDVNKIMEEAP